MVRIEYEYPLFKVYYSNNSNNSNIRGNPAVREAFKKGMSRSAGHCFLSNVKLQGLEDRWFRGLTKITYQLFFSVFRDIFYIMVFRQ